jgi:hypothetical protein
MLEKTMFCGLSKVASGSLPDAGPILGTCCALCHTERPNATDAVTGRLPVSGLRACHFRVAMEQVQANRAKLRSVNRHPVV